MLQVTTFIKRSSEFDVFSLYQFQFKCFSTLVHCSGSKYITQKVTKYFLFWGMAGVAAVGVELTPNPAESCLWSIERGRDNVPSSPLQAPRVA